jgi:hypothetical protein
VEVREEIDGESGRVKIVSVFQRKEEFMWVVSRKLYPRTFVGEATSPMNVCGSATLNQAPYMFIGDLDTPKNIIYVHQFQVLTNIFPLYSSVPTNVHQFPIVIGY